MNFQALELGRSIQHSLQGRIDISKVLKYFLGIRISLTTMSPIVIREAESIVHAILLVGEVLVVILPNALELFHILFLKYGARVTTVSVNSFTALRKPHPVVKNWQPRGSKAGFNFSISEAGA
jgi:hypothetical protein